MGANWKDEHKIDGYYYLSDYKKTRLPHGLCRVIAQVLIILRRNDGWELLQGMFGVFMDEDGWLVLCSGRGLHKAFANPLLHLGDCLRTLCH